VISKLVTFFQMSLVLPSGNDKESLHLWPSLSCLFSCSFVHLFTKQEFDQMSTEYDYNNHAVLYKILIFHLDWYSQCTSWNQSGKYLYRQGTRIHLASQVLCDLLNLPYQSILCHSPFTHWAPVSAYAFSWHLWLSDIILFFQLLFLDYCFL
jgi:hypothetical protein